MADYWTERKERMQRKNDRTADETLSEIKAYYRSTGNELSKSISGFYARYGHDNVIEYQELLKKLPKRDVKLLYEDMEAFFDLHPSLKHLQPIREKYYILSRFEGMKFDIIKQLTLLGEKEDKAMRKMMEGVYKDSYKDSKINIADFKGIKAEFNTISKRTLQTSITRKWVDEKNFSDRIWNNKAQLVNYLDKEFKQGVARGDSIHDLTKTLQNRMNVEFGKAERLVRTEVNYIENQAEAFAYEEDGITEYEYLANLDTRTSDICRSLDGKIFKLSEREVGVNYPPAHTRCRSTTVPVINT
jgi:SPP1 gp7 family putative phage head morphogenesis protein